MPDKDETPPSDAKFDFSAFPENTLFYDRRSGLEGRDRRAPEPIEPVAEAISKRKPERRVRKDRRRRIDPTTFEKQYTDDEIEFMHALDEYKRANGRMFPTCSEILEVVRALGYARQTPAPLADAPAAEMTLNA